MLATRARATSLAALLALGGLGALATPAHAADGAATIKLDSDEVYAGDILRITGTCPGGTTSAVVTVEQEDSIVDEKAVNLSPNGAFSADLDLMDAWGGDATASVDCVGYTGSTGRASTDFEVFEEDWPFEEIEVALSQQKVALGGTLTVSATCPKGSNLAAVIALNEDADPFFVQELTPAANGGVSATVKIAATEGVEPEVGNAIAAVLCAEDSSLSVPQLLGDTGLAGKLLASDQPMTAMAEAEVEEEFALTALGEAEFTITPAVVAPTVPTTPTAPAGGTAPAASPAAAPAAPTSTRAASAVPQQLAYTGAEPAPLAAIALALIAAGGVAIRRARRA